MILVTGATGNLGKAVISSLLNRGISANNIAALVRSEAKAAELKSKGIQVKIGDYEDFESLKRAFKDVDKLLLISSSAEIAQRFEQHKNVINAAKESGVNHIIYTSFNMKDLRRSIMVGDVQYHAETSDYLKQIAVPYTLMENTLYADLIPMLTGNNILEEGLSIPARNGKTPFLPIAEMAEALAVVMTTAGHEGKEYIIAAETAFSFAEIADLISDILGKKVTYCQPKVDSYIAKLVQNGFSNDDSAYLARYGEAIARGEFDTNKSNVKQLLGRSPISLKDFLKGIYGK
ncbi:NAD(P)H dehydrogenase (quinone) [Chryseobacterium ginsenosidimutans]|uniref:SDR family oxidoreductase n=1 Tax=Chryseobacterium ginsenosidimutans TaxID=687846 RepID=UPI00278AD1D0|nr:SDR family oxidoreductase [Chryseobacterium ginsenosidimutans]MDQ0594825.1 NAD(P)H dehydrogenase (quinone) [Chryseobacterium ginsenosidimutans]